MANISMLDTIGLIISAYSPAPQSAAVTAACPCRNLNDEAPHGNELELLVAVEQSPRHDGGGSEKQVDGQQLAQCPQDVAVVITGYQP